MVYAVTGDSIEVIHTDAEGRMLLADVLALASRKATIPPPAAAAPPPPFSPGSITTIASASTSEQQERMGRGEEQKREGGGGGGGGAKTWLPLPVGSTSLGGPVLPKLVIDYATLTGNHFHRTRECGYFILFVVVSFNYHLCLFFNL